MIADKHNNNGSNENNFIQSHSSTVQIIYFIT